MAASLVGPDTTEADIRRLLRDAVANTGSPLASSLIRDIVWLIDERVSFRKTIAAPRPPYMESVVRDMLTELTSRASVGDAVSRLTLALDAIDGLRSVEFDEPQRRSVRIARHLLACLKSGIDTIVVRASVMLRTMLQDDRVPRHLTQFLDGEMQEMGQLLQRVKQTRNIPKEAVPAVIGALHVFGGVLATNVAPAMPTSLRASLVTQTAGFLCGSAEGAVRAEAAKLLEMLMASSQSAASVPSEWKANTHDAFDDALRTLRSSAQQTENALIGAVVAGTTLLTSKSFSSSTVAKHLPVFAQCVLDVYKAASARMPNLRVAAVHAIPVIARLDPSDGKRNAAFIAAIMEPLRTVRDIQDRGPWFRAFGQLIAAIGYERLDPQVKTNIETVVASTVSKSRIVSFQDPFVLAADIAEAAPAAGEALVAKMLPHIESYPLSSVLASSLTRMAKALPTFSSALNDALRSAVHRSLEVELMGDDARRLGATSASGAASSASTPQQPPSGTSFFSFFKIGAGGDEASPSAVAGAAKGANGAAGGGVPTETDRRVDEESAVLLALNIMAEQPATNGLLVAEVLKLDVLPLLRRRSSVIRIRAGEVLIDRLAAAVASAEDLQEASPRIANLIEAFLRACLYDPDMDVRHRHVQCTAGKAQVLVEFLSQNRARDLMLALLGDRDRIRDLGLQILYRSYQFLSTGSMSKRKISSPALLSAAASPHTAVMPPGAGAETGYVSLHDTLDGIVLSSLTQLEHSYDVMRLCRSVADLLRFAEVMPALIIPHHMRMIRAIRTRLEQDWQQTAADVALVALMRLLVAVLAALSAHVRVGTSAQLTQQSATEEPTVNITSAGAALGQQSSLRRQPSGGLASIGIDINESTRTELAALMRLVASVVHVHVSPGLKESAIRSILHLAEVSPSALSCISTAVLDDLLRTLQTTTSAEVRETISIVLGGAGACDVVAMGRQSSGGVAASSEQSFGGGAGATGDALQSSAGTPALLVRAPRLTPTVVLARVTVLVSRLHGDDVVKLAMRTLLNVVKDHVDVDATDAVRRVIALARSRVAVHSDNPAANDALMTLSALISERRPTAMQQVGDIMDLLHRCWLPDSPVFLAVLSVVEALGPGTELPSDMVEAAWPWLFARLADAAFSDRTVSSEKAHKVVGIFGQCAVLRPLTCSIVCGCLFGLATASDRTDVRYAAMVEAVRLVSRQQLHLYVPPLVHILVQLHQQLRVAPQDVQAGHLVPLFQALHMFERLFPSSALVVSQLRETALTAFGSYNTDLVQAIHDPSSSSSGAGGLLPRTRRFESPTQQGGAANSVVGGGSFGDPNVTLDADIVVHLDLVRAVGDPTPPQVAEWFTRFQSLVVEKSPAPTIATSASLAAAHPAFRHSIFAPALHVVYEAASDSIKRIIDEAIARCIDRGTLETATLCLTYLDFIDASSRTYHPRITRRSMDDMDGRAAGTVPGAGPRTGQLKKTRAFDLAADDTAIEALGSTSYGEGAATPQFPSDMGHTSSPGLSRSGQSVGLASEVPSIRRFGLDLLVRAAVRWNRAAIGIRLIEQYLGSSTSLFSGRRSESINAQQAASNSASTSDVLHRLAELYASHDHVPSVRGLLSTVSLGGGGSHHGATEFELLQWWGKANDMHAAALPDPTAWEGVVRTHNWLAQWDRALAAAKLARAQQPQVSSLADGGGSASSSTTSIAQHAATAAWMLGDWAAFGEFTERMPVADSRNPTKLVFSAALAIASKQYARVREFTTATRRLVEERLRGIPDLSFATAAEGVEYLQLARELDEAAAIAGLAKSLTAASAQRAIATQTLEQWNVRFRAMRPLSTLPMLFALGVRSLVAPPRQVASCWLRFAQCVQTSHPEMAQWAIARAMPATGLSENAASAVSPVALTSVSSATNQGSGVVDSGSSHATLSLLKTQPISATESAELSVGLLDLYWSTGRRKEAIVACQQLLHGASLAPGEVEGPGGAILVIPPTVSKNLTTPGGLVLPFAPLTGPGGTRMPATLRSSLHLKVAKWLQEYHREDFCTNPVKRDEIIRHLAESTQYDSASHASWHAWGLMNYRIRQFNKELSSAESDAYAEKAQQGFFAAISYSPSTADALQDILRLIHLWTGCPPLLEHVQNRQRVCDGVRRVPIACWAAIVPQLVGHLCSNGFSFRQVIEQILARLAVSMPQVVAFPLHRMIIKDNIDETEGSTSQPEAEAAAAYLLSLCDAEVVHGAKRVAMLLATAAVFPIECVAMVITRLPSVVSQGVKHHQRGHHAIAAQLYATATNLAKQALRMSTAHNVTIRDQQMAPLPGRLARLLRHCEQGEWNPGVQLAMRITNDLNRDIQAMSSFRFSATFPQMVASIKSLKVAMPGEFRFGQPDDYVTVANIDDHVHVISTQHRPRKVTLVGSDGEKYQFVLKGHEDLRQDERVMQLFAFVNTQLIAKDPSSAAGRLQTYSAVPLTKNVGLLGWVEDSNTFSECIVHHRQHHQIDYMTEKNAIVEICGEQSMDRLTPMQRADVLYAVSQSFRSEDIARTMWLDAPSSDVWLRRRKVFTESAAVASMVGYVIGLGDRHLGNLMLNPQGGVVHIDFGDCFDVARCRLRFPETVPFRLTPMIVNALEVFGVRGLFRSTAVNAMSLLRDKRDSITALLTVFVFDPTVSIRLDSNVVSGEQLRVIVERLRCKLLGTDQPGSSAPFTQRKLTVRTALSVPQQVDALIDEATSLESLGLMYHGWCAWL